MIKILIEFLINEFLLYSEISFDLLSQVPLPLFILKKENFDLNIMFLS